jgi:glucosamine 6-phosphate synthetase-like amidotransferase/phosphosugar isomerase protein
MTIDEFIAEQPEVLEAVLAEVPGQLAALGPIHSARPIYLVGAGTSRNALVGVEPLFDRLVPAGARVRGPLAFLAETAGMRKGKGIAIFLSQTGTTATTVQAVSHAVSLGWRTLTVTADRRSPVGRVSGEIVVIPVGREPVGPKTKGYTASVLTLILMARALAGQDVQPGEFTGELSRLIAYARGVVAELAEMREGCDFFMILGQERHYATALEGSLKISEMSGVAAAAFDTEEAFHGRFHGLSSFSAALFVAGTPAQYDMAAAGAAVLADLGIASRILNLTASLPGPHDLPLPWPATDKCAELDLISAVVPFQLLACELARRRGVSPERMRYPDLAQHLRITTGLTD